MALTSFPKSPVAEGCLGTTPQCQAGRPRADRGVATLKPSAAIAIVQAEPLVSRFQMTQTTNRLFDDFAKLMTDAAGAADGLKRETEALFRSQAEKFLRDMNVVTREDFEAVRDMAQKARQENEALAARVAQLEAQLAKLSPQGGSPVG